MCLEIPKSRDGRLRMLQRFSLRPAPRPPLSLTLRLATRPARAARSQEPREVEVRGGRVGAAEAGSLVARLAAARAHCSAVARRDGLAQDEGCA